MHPRWLSSGFRPPATPPTSRSRPGAGGHGQRRPAATARAPPVVRREALSSRGRAPSLPLPRRSDHVSRRGAAAAPASERRPPTRGDYAPRRRVWRRGEGKGRRLRGERRGETGSGGRGRRLLDPPTTPAAPRGGATLCVRSTAGTAGRPAPPSRTMSATRERTAAGWLPAEGWRRGRSSPSFSPTVAPARIVPPAAVEGPPEDHDETRGTEVFA